MNNRFFTRETFNLIRLAIACLLILTAAGVNLFAQHRGAPVKRERLVQALRSRQFQTRDIVAIINSNGVDFRLTPEVKRTLTAAGARAEVIQAISNNLRLPFKDKGLLAKADNRNQNNQTSRSVVVSRNKPAPATYEDLLSRAISSYKDQRNPQNAVSFLRTAAKVKPGNPAAYQMMGFVYLYGMNNFAQAEQSMRESISNGGSAVFRVFHDDNGKFTERCTGSLYISGDTLRFESDDNKHTFETSATNISKIKLDTQSTRDWKKHSVFKVHLKFGNEEAKFRFSPLTGDQQESKMVERFVAAANSNKSPTGSSMAQLVK